MKKLLTCLLLAISLGASPQPSKTKTNSNWIYMSSGRYHIDRYKAFEDGINMLNRQKAMKASLAFRSSLTNTYRFNYQAYNNYAASEALLDNYDQAIGLFTKSINSGGDPDIANYNIFICYLNGRDYQEALLKLEELPLYLKAQNPEAIATCYIHNDMFLEAYNYYRIFIGRDSLKVSDPSYFNASVAAWEISDTALAITYIQKALEKNSKADQYWTQLGKIYLCVDPLLAIYSFKRAASLNSENTEAQVGLGYAYISSGMGRKAAGIFEALIKNGNIKNPDIFQALAISYNQSGQTEKSLEQMRIVATLRSLNQTDERIIGDCWLNKDSLANATIHYSNALRTGFDPDAEFGMAIIYFLQDKSETSLQSLELISQNRPDYRLSSYALFLKAMLYYTLGRYEEFSSQIDNTKFSKCKEASQLMIMAIKSMSQFQYDQAQRFLRKAIKLNPDNINLNLIQGTILFQTGQIKEAVAIFKAAHRLDPENIEIMNSLALAMAENGESEKAIQLMLAVISKNKKGRYYNNMSLILMHAADGKESDKDYYCSLFETAIQYVDSAISAGASPEFSINKGNYYYLLNDTAKANEYFRQFRSPYTLNNLAIFNSHEANQSSSLDLMEEAVKLSGKNVCPIININHQLLSTGYSYTNSSKLEFIYLYQIMPAILPSTHVFSYSFTMGIEKPAYNSIGYIYYNSLDEKRGEDLKFKLASS